MESEWRSPYIILLFGCYRLLPSIGQLSVNRMAMEISRSPGHALLLKSGLPAFVGFDVGANHVDLRLRAQVPEEPLYLALHFIYYVDEMSIQWTFGQRRDDACSCALARVRMINKSLSNRFRKPLKALRMARPSLLVALVRWGRPMR